MSCHDIGRGVDWIMEHVLKMYDDGKISQEAALEMVKTFPQAVNWCDGNTYEAQGTLARTHCACCLKKYESAEDIVYSSLAEDAVAAEDVTEAYRGWWWDKVMKKAGFSGLSVCKECFRKVFAPALTETGMKKVLAIDAKKTAAELSHLLR